MAEGGTEAFRALLSALLPLGPAVWFGLCSKPKEMGLAILAGSIAAAFLNIDKIKSFKGGGCAAEMRELQKAKAEAYATIEELRQVTKPVLELGLYTLASYGRVGGMDTAIKHRLRDDILRIAKDVKVSEDAALQSADDLFIRLHTWDHFSAFVESLPQTTKANLRSMQNYLSDAYPSRQDIETALHGQVLDDSAKALLDDYLYYMRHRHLQGAKSS
jgi:hypothetical protein